MVCESIYIPQASRSKSHLRCRNTDTSTSQPSQATHKAHFSHQLVSGTMFSSSSPVSPLFVHHSTILGDYQVKSSFSISRNHDHELTLSTVYIKYSIRQVQYTLSAAHTEYRIRWVQHSRNRASTQGCLLAIHSHDYRLTLEYCFSCMGASGHDWLLPTCSPWDQKGEVTLSHPHACKLTN
jgi:hypothetical protein